MLSFYLICFIAGSISAILQGMLGIGVGIIIIPMLNFILPMYGIPHQYVMHIALTTALAVIAVNSISAIISHHFSRNIHWDIFKQMILFNLLGAFLGVLIAGVLSGNFLKILFGIFLVVNAGILFFKKIAIESASTDLKFSRVKIAIGGFWVSLISSLVGTGGGVLLVPFLHSFKLKMRYAVGTATLISFPVTALATITYIIIGWIKTVPVAHTIGYLYWPAFVVIIFAGIILAPVGVKIASKLHSNVLQRIFAFCILLIGIMMLLNQ